MAAGSYLNNQLLVAMPSLADPNFSHSVTLVCEHNERGALGIVINRPLEMKMSEVLEQLALVTENRELRDMPFDELKVDRSFVHGAATDDKKRAICHASLSLARQLGISVVAEGVEDQDDWQFLSGEGCDFAQGYFIARPMPGEKIQAWIEDWVARVRGGSPAILSG